MITFLELFPLFTLPYLIWMEGETFGGPYPLPHEAIVIANVVEQFFSLDVVYPDGLLGRGTAEKN